MKIKKNDKVKIIAGKDRGKEGKVLQASEAESKVVVEGVNKIKKHVKPRKSGQKGQVVEMEFPINASNVMLVCPKCGKVSKIGYKSTSDKNKFRVCKKCKSEI
jgi:large subunit ribosomal protein L24